MGIRSCIAFLARAFGAGSFFSSPLFASASTGSLTGFAGPVRTHARRASQASYVTILSEH